MVLTKTQISELYVSIFNRASEKSGSQNWLNSGYNTDATAMANAMLATDDAKEYFGASLLTDKAFVDHIYKNTLNKGEGVDETGKAVWVEYLKGHTRGEMVVAMIEAIKAYQVGGAKYATADQIAKDAAQQFDNRVKVSDYTADNLETIAVSEINSTLSFGGALKVTADPATVETAKKSVQALTIDGTTFTLTTGGDTFVGTEKNDLFDASVKNTLNTADVLLDSTSTDADILNALVTTSNTAARLQNIETVNIKGEYVSTGLDLTNVTGTKDLNLSTGTTGGTAKVLAANTIAVENITVDSSIDKLEVSSLTSGTRDTVNVDAGSADVTLTGSTGADKYAVTMAANTTLTTTAINTASDALTANIAGDLTLTTAGVTNAELALTLVNNATTASTVTATNGTGTIAKTLTLSGNDIVVDAGDGKSLSSTALNTGGTKVTSDASSSTIEISATGGAGFFNKAVVDNVLISADLSGQTVTVNESSKVILEKNQTNLTLNIENVDGDMFSSVPKKTGALLVDANTNQTKLTTVANVDTLLVTAGALENDADGNTVTLTIGNIVTDAATNTVVLSGANPLQVTTFTGKGDETIIATSMTGSLTITDSKENATIKTGSGDDSISTLTAKVLKVETGAGDDTINLTTAAAGSTANAGTGDDTIITSGNGDTIDAGAGDDTVTLTGVAGTADTVTLGAGADTVTLNIASGKTDNTGHTIKDFTAGEDTLVVTGIAVGALDLTNLAVTTATNTYTLSTGVDIVLTNNTAKDLSNSIQLGNATTAYTAAAGVAVTAGVKDDVIAVKGANTIKTGAGEDTIVVATTEKTAVVSDFTVGSDKVVLTGAVGTTLVKIDLTKVTVASDVLTLSDNHAIKLTNGTNSILADGTLNKDASTMVQLGDSITAFTADTATTDITGGIFDDYIALGTGGVNVHFINDGGTDTITGFANAVSDKLVFGAIDGIVAGQTGKAITKATKATSGDVYVMTATTAIAGDKIDYSKIGVKVNNEVVKVTDASIMEDVAAYLNNALTDVKANHTYVAVINDGVAGGVTAYTYLINTTSDTITAADITLNGIVTASADLVAGDIA